MTSENQINTKNVLTLDGCRILRENIQETTESLKLFEGGSRERSLVITKLQEAKMWLGKEMGNLGGEDLNKKRDEEIMNKN